MCGFQVPTATLGNKQIIFLFIIGIKLLCNLHRKITEKTQNCTSKEANYSDCDGLVSLERRHMFFIFSYTVQMEQMVSGSNMLSLGGPVFFQIWKGKWEKTVREGGNPLSFGTDRHSDLLSSLLSDRQEWKDEAVKVKESLTVSEIIRDHLI